MKTRIIFYLMIFTGLIYSSCVKDEVFEGPPTAGELSISPQAPRDVDPVNVSVVVTDLNGIKSVTLFYSVDQGAFSSLPMQQLGGAPNTFIAQIPAQGPGKTVTYYVEAENVSGQKTYIPEGAPETTATYTIGAPSIVMNEIYSRGTVEEPDWIEIYNNSDSPADISGFSVYDAGGQSGAKPKKTFPAGTLLAAHGFFVIVVDDAEESGFGLSSGGEEVWFENATGSIIDNATFPAFEATQSYGRIPDGNGEWTILDQITKGAANDNSPATPIILINELYSTGTVENPDWVEIYNGSATEIDITGYKIYDSGGQAGTKEKKVFPAGSVIPAGGFLVIVVDDDAVSGFGLSGSGEQVWLENAGGTVIDEMTFPALVENQSYGRFPDGSTDLQIMNTVTKGAANSNVEPNPTIIILMNEIFSKGVDPDFDWVEIYNGSTVEVDLSGYTIYDSGGQSGVKPKKGFPAGTIIPAGGFFVIVTDDGTESGFGLSSGGEEVWLENAEAVIIDDQTFPAMIDGQSYGRKPDGSATFFTFTEITRGASNNNAATLPKIRK